jgi:hypothetical protein
VCASQVLVEPADTALLTRVSSGAAFADDLGVEVQLYMWTNTTAAGQPCTQAEASCGRFMQSLVLRLSPDGAALVAGVTPDASVDQYLFVVKVGWQ